MLDYSKQLFIFYAHEAKVPRSSRIGLYETVLSPHIVRHYCVWCGSISKLCASRIFQ